jgi:hypothetical protein
MDSSGSQQGLRYGEGRNESSSSGEGGEFLDQMSSNQLLMKDLLIGVNNCYLVVFCCYMTLHSDYV